MNSAHSARELVGDPPRPMSQTSVASWYTHGVTDGLGDRLLMFDNTAAASLEMLRFRREFSASPRFERALRKSVECLAPFKHPAFSQVRSVQYIEGDDGLALVSTHVPGKRLSAMFHGSERPTGMHPAFATWLIRQLGPALAEFHGHGPGVAHGALTADRIVLTEDRRLVIVEHALGAALDEQRMSAEELWRSLGVITVQRFDAAPRLDSRSDFIQLGLVALSVLLGRRITPDEYPEKLDLLLDEFSESAARRSPSLAAALRDWLERTLKIDDEFASSIEGHAVRELAQWTDPSSDQQLQVSPLQAIASRPESGMNEIALTSTAESHSSLASQTREWDDPKLPRRFSIVRNVAVALGVVALIEAAVIGRMMGESTSPRAPVAEVPVTIESLVPGMAVLVDGRDVGVTPLQLNVGSTVRSIRVVAPGVPQVDTLAAAPVPPTVAPDTRTAEALAAAAARQRTGGLRLTSPIELTVLEGERVLGSSADGPIVAPAGTHQLDFINTALGYRSRQIVDFRAGQILPLRIDPPDGMVSINAQPWAQVSIDGNAIGETPLANVSVPVGQHEIVFRHPQLGERRQTIVVKSGVQTRISASFSR